MGCVLVQWTFHPFILKSKKIYTVLVWCRVLAILVVSAIIMCVIYVRHAVMFWVLFKISMIGHWFIFRLLFFSKCCSAKLLIVFSWKTAFSHQECISLLTFAHSIFQACQILRIVTFYSTQLPGPNYHCREVIPAKSYFLWDFLGFFWFFPSFYMRIRLTTCFHNVKTTTPSTSGESQRIT